MIYLLTFALISTGYPIKKRTDRVLSPYLNLKSPTFDMPADRMDIHKAFQPICMSSSLN